MNLSLQDIGIAIAILATVGGALIKLNESIINQITSTKIKEYQKDSDKQDEKQSNRISRLERLTAILETRVLGDSDTFSGID